MSADVVTLDAIKAAILNDQQPVDYVFICPLCWAELSADGINRHIDEHYPSGEGIRPDMSMMKWLREL